MYVYISLVVEDKDMERQAMKDQIVVLSHSLEEAEGIYIYIGLSELSGLSGPLYIYMIQCISHIKYIKKTCLHNDQ